MVDATSISCYFGSSSSPLYSLCDWGQLLAAGSRHIPREQIWRFFRRCALSAPQPTSRSFQTIRLFDAYDDYIADAKESLELGVIPACDASIYPLYNLWRVRAIQATNTLIHSSQLARFS
eukprot:scaffold310035_cov27-Tisochrysis_lutea.AAC.3